MKSFKIGYISNMPSSQKYIFMSYSRKDETVMRRVKKFLRRQGITLWVDNEKLKPGTNAWEAEIEKAIPSSSAVVVLLSPDAKQSKWVRREITLADQYNIQIYPVLIKGNENNAIFLRLITRQYIDIRGEKEESGLNSLFVEISSYIKDLEKQEPGEKTETPYHDNPNQMEEESTWDLELGSWGRELLELIKEGRRLFVNGHQKKWRQHKSEWWRNVIDWDQKKMAPHIEKRFGELAKEDYLNPVIELEIDAKLGDDDLNRKLSILATRLGRARKMLE